MLRKQCRRASWPVLQTGRGMMMHSGTSKDVVMVNSLTTITTPVRA